MRINEQRYFDEPFGRSGYRIELDGDLADHVFLVDGTCSGGRHELNGDETARLIASFLFRAMTTHVAETLLGTLVDLNQGGNQ